MRLKDSGSRDVVSAGGADISQHSMMHASTVARGGDNILAALAEEPELSMSV